MKLTKLSKVLLLAVVVLSAFAFISCDLFGELLGVTIPSELRGKWSWTGSSYYESFTFTATEVSYFGQSIDYPGEFTAGWSREIKELYEDERIIQLDNDAYLRYTITGSKLYLQQTNPHTEKPDAGYDWGVGYNLTKE